MNKLPFYWLCMFTSLLKVACTQTQPPERTENSSSSEANSTYQLVWSDEFDTYGLPDSTKWNYDVGDGCPQLCGWGNNELQYYTEKRLENARIENGMLVIEAHQEAFQNSEFTSARLVTQHKGDWRYGKFLISAKLPKGRGTWPAIWMLSTLEGNRQWPLDGEIDIMEHVGYDEGNVHGTIHTSAFNHMKGTQLSGNVMVADATEAFHEYGIEWTPTFISWLLDGEEYFRIQNQYTSLEEWPFDQYSFHLILNIAVGGNWGGKEGVDDSIWPQRMEVDYARVYQKK